jgi:hypothetical protein
VRFIGNKKSASLNELNELLNTAFARWLTHTGPNTLWASCASCHHMEKYGPAFCGKYGLTPPVQVIVGEKDCEGYSNVNEIPF